MTKRKRKHARLDPPARASKRREPEREAVHRLQFELAHQIHRGNALWAVLLATRREREVLRARLAIAIARAQQLEAAAHGVRPEHLCGVGMIC
jgi:hypothetical protein